MVKDSDEYFWICKVQNNKNNEKAVIAAILMWNGVSRYGAQREVYLGAILWCFLGQIVESSKEN